MKNYYNFLNKLYLFKNCGQSDGETIFALNFLFIECS
jgi:hypothetical protein